MRRAILQRFILVLFGALILNSLIFYLLGSRILLNSSSDDMLYMLEVQQPGLRREPGGILKPAGSCDGRQ